MNSGNSVQDAAERRAVTAQDADLPDLELHTLDKQDEDATEVVPPSVSVPQAPVSVPQTQNIRDIQELIDKLAAVTKQLRYPGHS
jgi:hypothetical protein